MSTYDEKLSSPPAAGDKKAEGKEPSGYKGDDPSTSGSGSTKVDSNTPEGKTQQINPSSPGDTGVTPGSVDEIA